MNRLGAVLAGGAARRFGGDKAAATIEGVTLIDRAIAALRPHCDAIVVVGRTHERVRHVGDRPRHGLGPLGGLAGALHYATGNDHDDVLTVPCDVPFPPDVLFAALDRGPAVIADHPVFGIWPSSLTAGLDAWLEGGRPRAMKAFADAVGARAIEIPAVIRDVDTRADLMALS